MEPNKRRRRRTAAGAGGFCRSAAGGELQQASLRPDCGDSLRRRLSINNICACLAKSIRAELQAVAQGKDIPEGNTKVQGRGKGKVQSYLESASDIHHPDEEAARGRAGVNNAEGG